MLSGVPEFDHPEPIRHAGASHIFRNTELYGKIEEPGVMVNEMTPRCRVRRDPQREDAGHECEVAAMALGGRSLRL